MSLIADRPHRWNQVVGQERVIRLLHALLKNPKRITRGLIFDGPWAVGKTSCAYLFARGLMCQSGGLGCGECTSCVTADEALESSQSLESHPSVTELDAAKFPDAESARKLISDLNGPVAARRKVVIIDEAHNLSPVAFDVFLKPLEANDTDVVFLFVSSKGDQIPPTIRSRCSVIRFGRVDQDALTGMLLSAADREAIPYRMDGLRLIAHYAQGRPRDAMKTLSLVSALGEITVENVESAVNFEARMVGEEVYTGLVTRETAIAIKKADELAQRIGPTKVIETMFSLYMQDISGPATFVSSFAPLKDMTALFIKWSSSHYLPADIIPLFVIELNEMRDELYRKPEQERVRTFQAPVVIPKVQEAEAPKPLDRVLSPADMAALLEQ